MEIVSKINDEVLKIAVIGELDANSAVHLDHVIQKALSDRFYKIIIDCQELDYISSAGLGVFISYIEEMRERNGRFVFINMKEKVFNVFRILGLEKVISIVPDYETAKKALSES